MLVTGIPWGRTCRSNSGSDRGSPAGGGWEEWTEAGIEATLRLGLTNARIEAVNTTLRLIVRRAYGFHSAEALIALAMLTVGGLRPDLPGRARAALRAATATLHRLAEEMLRVAVRERAFAHGTRRSPQKGGAATGPSPARPRPPRSQAPPDRR